MSRRMLYETTPPARLKIFPAEQLQRLLDQLTPHFSLILGGQASSPHHVHNTVAEHGSIGSDHFGDGQCSGDLHCRYAGFF